MQAPEVALAEEDAVAAVAEEDVAVGVGDKR